MTTLKPFDNLLAIEVPIDAYDIQDTYADGIMWRMPNGDYDSFYFEIEPRFDYKILGCVTPTGFDFDVEPYVERIVEERYGMDGEIYSKDVFLDYELNAYWLSYEESFRSLLSYNGIEIKEGFKLVILQKQ